MIHPFNEEKIREIIWKQIEQDENPGEHVGGSGHLGQIDCWISEIDKLKRVAEGWEITYRYKVSITTEFTVYPDNPPYETIYEKTIIINDAGEILVKLGSKLISSNIDHGDLFDLKDPLEGNGDLSDNMVQRVIDLETGRDITGEYINQRLKELEILADDIIQRAVNNIKMKPENIRKTYENAYWMIHEKLGIGSIGPATAVAAGLMVEKQIELAEILGINDEDRIG